MSDFTGHHTDNRLAAQLKVAAQRTGLCCFVTLILFAVLELPAVRADDLDPLDRELLDALEGLPANDSPQRIIPRLIEGTQTASERLQQGQLDPDTAALQAQILADIDALLEQSSPPRQLPQNPPSSNSASQPPQSPQSQQVQSQQQGQSSQDGDSQQAGKNDPNAASKESAERHARGEEGDGERERRLGLSTAAWGHLPPKVREQMRSAFSEEYLPEYDALVRRYYEALARRRSGDSANPD